MTNFAQPVSMPCTEPEYSRDLKEGLEKLGYKEAFAFNCVDVFPQIAVICNNMQGEMGRVGFAAPISRYSSTRHFIPEYNPELFLAIAGMREGDIFDINMGEYAIAIKDHREGEIVKRINADYSGFAKQWRKATVDELINHFKKEKMYTLEDLRQGKVLMERSKNIDELNDVLGYLNPNDTRKAEGAFPYYFFSHGNWGGASVNLNNKPTQSVALFHDQLPKKETKIEHKTNNQRFEELERNYTELQGAVKDMRKSFDDFKKGMEERVNPVKSQKERLIEMLEKSYYNAIDLCGLGANVKTVVTINTTTYELERLIKELKS